MPTALEGARPSDIEAIGEALILQLVGAATLRVGATSMRAPLEASGPEGADSFTRHNIAQLVGAWPPSDRTLAALIKALGLTPSAGVAGRAAPRSAGDGDGKPAGSHGDDERRGLHAPGSSAVHGSGHLHAALSAEPGVRRALIAHLQKARSKCPGTALDTLSLIMRGTAAAAKDPQEDSEDEEVEEAGRPARRSKRRGAVQAAPAMAADGDLPDFESASARAALEASARGAISELKSQRSLYSSTRLPNLKPPPPPGKRQKKA